MYKYLARGSLPVVKKAGPTESPRITHKEASMEKVYYVGLDVHKKVIAYCIKLQDGTVFRRGEVSAERRALRQWLKEMPERWKGAMEATLFTLCVTWS